MQERALINAASRSVSDTEGKLEKEGHMGKRGQEGRQQICRGEKSFS